MRVKELDRSMSATVYDYLCVSAVARLLERALEALHFLGEAETRRNLGAPSTTMSAGVSIT